MTASIPAATPATTASPSEQWLTEQELEQARLFLQQTRSAVIGATPALTVTSSILGSPVYMAPEQLRDARTVDARADIWAIGVGRGPAPAGL